MYEAPGTVCVDDCACGVAVVVVTDVGRAMAVEGKSGAVATHSEMAHLVVGQKVSHL